MQQFFFVSFSDSENHKCVNEFISMNDAKAFMLLCEYDDCILHTFNSGASVPEDVEIFRSAKHYAKCFDFSEGSYNLYRIHQSKDKRELIAEVVATNYHDALKISGMLDMYRNQKTYGDMVAKNVNGPQRVIFMNPNFI